MATRTIRTTPSSIGPTEVDPRDRTTRFAIDVAEGRVVAGPHVRNACRRHLDDLAHGSARGLTYDLAAAEHVWRFFEGVLKLSEGQFEAQPFLLHPSQAFKLGSLFGWKRADGSRRFRRAYIEEGKGNGKSPFAGGVGLYGLTADGEAGAQIYAAGAKKDQAGILFADAVKMVRKAPALAKRLQFSGGIGREYNIANHSTGGFFRPISKDAGKTGSGPRPHFALCDEVHEHPNRDVMEMLERGFKFRRQPLLLMITNSGHDRHSICWEEHEHAVRVAAGTRTPDDAFTYVGEPIDDETFSWVAALDKDDDPFEDPRCWAKANPLLGTILTEEYLAGVVRQAKAMPGKANGILRLHFCRWTDADQAWISREALDAVLAEFDPATEHADKTLNLGLDLSGTQDLSAAGVVVETGQVEREGEDGRKVMLPTYDAWIEAWIPGDKVQDKTAADQAPYDVWVEQGFLRAPPGTRVRFDFIAAWLAQLAQDHQVRGLGYDRYAYSKFAEELDAAGVKIPEWEHPQGGRRRAKVPDEIVEAARRQGVEPPQGLWMPGSLNFLEELILDRRIRIRRNPVFVSAAMSAAIEEDAFGNRWFSKRRATQRIDPLVALAMAVGVAQMVLPPPPVYRASDLIMVI